MVEIIAGVKGTGKTKHMLERAAEDIKKSEGSIVYVDKNSKHSFEVDSRIRLISMSDYPIESEDGFIGFLYGMISQNSDIQEIFLDSFLTIGFIDSDDALTRAIELIDTASQKFDVNFVISVSKNPADLPANVREKVI